MIAANRGPLQPAVFLDRDGVINENRSDYVKSWEEFVFLPDVFGALRTLANIGQPIVVISNQSAIGRGLVLRGTIDDINRSMVSEIEHHGGRIDACYYCPHDPKEGCDCKNPRLGLLIRAARELNLDLSRSDVIGDALSDSVAGPPSPA